MANNATLRGLCPEPFYMESSFSSTGGFIDGRLCQPVPQLAGLSCCLPCPSSDWIYADSFKTVNVAAGWTQVVGAIMLCFLALSYAVLPKAKTNKHYLNLCLMAACALICLGFIIPLGADSQQNDKQCYNEITPNDMYSSTSCAFSGAFILFGGISALFWVSIRVMSMFLQIVFGIAPGRKSFIVYQLIGWICPAAIFIASITATGVSFRFGSACHINHKNSMASFWGWLLGIAGVTIIMQFITIGYCLKVYLSNLFASYREEAEEISASPASTSSFEKGFRAPSVTADRAPKASTREIYEEVMTVLYVQWRIMLMTTLTLIDVVFFAVVFVYVDASADTTNPTSVAKSQPWLLCLVEHGGDKTPCLGLAQSWLVNQATIGAVLFLLALIPINVVILLFRWSIFGGWREWIAQHVTHRGKFVSLSNLTQVRTVEVYSPTDHAGSEHSAMPLNTMVQREYEHEPQVEPKRQSRLRFWHPNPRMQESQREGIMRTLKLSRARAQGIAETTPEGFSPSQPQQHHQQDYRPSSQPRSPQPQSNGPRLFAAPYGSTVPPAQGDPYYPQPTRSAHTSPTIFPPKEMSDDDHTRYA